MAGLATKETNLKVSDYVDRIENESKKADCRVLLELVESCTGYPPKVWGDYFIIGFGNYAYTRKGGKEEFEWFKAGFAVRKAKITLYLTTDIEKEKELLDQLGKCKWGRGCLYINKLADIDLDVLKQLIIKNKDANWQ